MKILAALALTIVGLLILMLVCYLMTYIPFVKWGFDIDKNDPIIIRILCGFIFITSGFIFITMCIIALALVLTPLGASFTMFYGLL